VFTIWGENVERIGLAEMGRIQEAAQGLAL
jgi:hypothetical protein